MLRALALSLQSATFFPRRAEGGEMSTLQEILDEYGFTLETWESDPDFVAKLINLILEYEDKAAK